MKAHTQSTITAKLKMFAVNSNSIYSQTEILAQANEGYDEIAVRDLKQNLDLLPVGNDFDFECNLHTNEDGLWCSNFMNIKRVC